MSNEKLNLADAIVQMWDIIDRAHPLDKPALKMALAALHEKEHNCNNCKSWSECRGRSALSEYGFQTSGTRCEEWESESE